VGSIEAMRAGGKRYESAYEVSCRELG